MNDNAIDGLQEFTFTFEITGLTYEPAIPLQH